MEGDTDNAVLIKAFELMRQFRKKTYFKEYQDIYNEAVFEINRDNLTGALRHFDLVTRIRRGLPISETKNQTEFINRNPVRAAQSLLDRAWKDGTCDSLNKVPNRYGPHIYYPEAKGTPFVTSVHKLRHDLAQINLLLSRGKIPSDIFVDVRDKYVSLLKEFPEDEPSTYFVLSSSSYASIAMFHQRLVYTPSFVLPIPKPSILGDNVNWKEVQRSYFENNEVVSADGILSEYTLSRLIEFCEESTIWYDIKPSYLGAYMNDGFSHPLLVEVAESLRAAMPELLGPHRLTQMWAYKYDAGSNEGIKIHADPAKVNLNLWITPNEYHKDGNGGLRVYLKRPPEDWTPNMSNDFQFEKMMMEFLGDAESRSFEYRQNRFVMFDSRLFHKTETFRFKDCYKCRRINLTFLFGDAG